MILINDLHLGCTRSAGVTPASAAALRQYSLDELAKFLTTTNEDLLIAGDLMDAWQVDLSTVLTVYRLFNEWLLKGHRLIVQAANHDLSTDTNKFGSLQFLMALFDKHPKVQFVFGEGAWVAEGVYCVPQMQNQDLYDMELAKVPTCKLVILHCNGDSPFSKALDHSLDISLEQIAALPAKFIYSGHEHHQRKLGKLFFGGVQWPTSISDVLDRKNKFAYRCVEGGFEPIKTWDAANYAELDWQNLIPSDAQFIRITGKATSEQGADVADAVAKYRRASTAFIVSSAVKVGEDRQGETVAQTLEDLRGVNVMELLREYVTPGEMTTLETLK